MRELRRYDLAMPLPSPNSLCYLILRESTQQHVNTVKTHRSSFYQAHDQAALDRYARVADADDLKPRKYSI